MKKFLSDLIFLCCVFGILIISIDEKNMIKTIGNFMIMLSVFSLIKDGFSKSIIYLWEKKVK